MIIETSTLIYGAIGLGAATLMSAYVIHRKDVSDTKKIKRMKIDSILSHRFSKTADSVLARERPDLTASQREKAWDGLKQYFALHAHTPGQFLGMPSETADAAWHSLLLCDKEYEEVCRTWFGKRIGHEPDPACVPGQLDGSFTPKADVIRTWNTYQALRNERDDLNLPQTSLLFTLDGEVGKGWIHTAESLDVLKNGRKRKSNESSESSGGSCGSTDTGMFNFSSQHSTHKSSFFDGWSGHDSSATADTGSSGDTGSSCGSSCGGGCGGD